MFRRVLTVSACLLIAASVAEAQQAPGIPPALSPACNGGERGHASRDEHLPGDTGLWFVPTGEVLPNRRWSGSGYYTNFDYTQGLPTSAIIGTWARAGPIELLDLAPRDAPGSRCSTPMASRSSTPTPVMAAWSTTTR